MAKSGAQAVIVQGFFDPHRAKLIPLQAKYRLGYMSPNRDTTAAGALVSLSSNCGPLFDNLVSAQQECLRDCQPEGLRSLEIDDEFELGWLLNREVGGLCALENLVHEARRPEIEV